MVLYEIIYADDFFADFIALEKSAPKLASKVYRMVKELEVQPRVGTGKPEPLKYISGEFWSRRIDRKNRLVYYIDESKKSVTLHYCRGHYEQLR